MRKSGRVAVLMTLSVVLLIACFCGPLMAGTLDDFEEEATKRAKADTVRGYEPTSATSCWSGCMESVIESGVRALFAGGSATLKRVKPPEPPDTLSVGWAWDEPPEPVDTLRIEPRVPGDVQIPIVCLGLRYQYVESDVSALDGRAEVGYGPLGLAVRYTHYAEESPADELGIVQWHGLYRMSFTEYVEVDIGFGQMTLHGDKRSAGSSVTVPVRIGFDIPVALVFRPTWSWIGDNEITDYDVGLLYLWPYASVSLGYRWLECGDSALSGAFVGVSGRF